MLNILTTEASQLLDIFSEQEFVDLKKLNLQSEYQKWNKKLFDGELPKIPITTGKMKKATGVTTAKAVRAKKGSKELKSVSDIAMKISTNLKLTKQEFDMVLIHEMIHVWFLTKNVDEQHGQLFKSKALELSRIVGFDIPLTHDVQNSQVDDMATTPKELSFILLIRPGGVYSLSLFSPKKAQELVPVIDRLSRGVPKGAQATVGKVRTNLGDKYTVFRSTKAIKMVKITKNEADSILNAAEVLRSEVKT